MRHHRKLPLIKLYSHRMKMIKIHTLMQHQENLYSSYFSQGSAVVHDTPQDEEPDEPQAQGDDDFDLSDYISSMTPKMKRDFRRSNPQLPDFFFLSKQEKKRFFSDLNNNFKKKITKAPQRKSKTKKRLSFTQDFEVRGFNQSHKVVNILKAKPIRETYSQELHFS